MKIQKWKLVEFSQIQTNGLNEKKLNKKCGFGATHSVHIGETNKIVFPPLNPFCSRIFIPISGTDCFQKVIDVYGENHWVILESSGLELDEREVSTLFSDSRRQPTIWARPKLGERTNPPGGCGEGEGKGTQAVRNQLMEPRDLTK